MLLFFFLLFASPFFPISSTHASPDSSSITYDPSANTITVVGYNQTDPCNFSLLYDADLAGSLQLMAPTSATANMSLSRQVQPADSLALKLDLNVTNLQLGQYENFTTFTEVEEQDDIQKNATHVDFLDRRDRTTYLYKDYDADHFGNFTHWLDVYRDTHATNSWVAFWLLATWLKVRKL